MTKKGVPFVEKVGGSDNWRHRPDVPADVQAALGKKRWSKSLKTAELREAARQARLLATQQAYANPRCAPESTSLHCRLLLA
jgi:hypothetical protein